MLTVRELNKITNGRLVQGSETSTVNGISIDTRKIRKGNVFIAIKGERYDGHDFVGRAVRKGAAVVISSKKINCSKNTTVIRVKETTKALGQIAAAHRSKFDVPVIAITGSTGKTTTKDMIASILQKRFKVLNNTGTQNNQFGVPLTLLKLNASHDIAVLELGTNRPGDIRWLAKIVRPTICLFTNIGESHLAKLKTPSGVLREKVQLINYLAADGTIILNGDDRYLASVRKKSVKQRMIRFGCHKRADVKASQVTVLNNRHLRFKVRAHSFKINSCAVHNVYNALAAISCGLACKIRYNDIIAALSRFRFCGGRQEIKRIGRLWLIDDTYNANPISLRSAINTLETMDVKGRRIVICADMLELGSRSKALHRSAGQMIGRSNTDVVLTTGRQARFITQGCNQLKKGRRALHCRDIKEVQRRVKEICRPGDAVLVKGSRAMHMERIVAYLTKNY